MKNGLRAVFCCVLGFVGVFRLVAAGLGGEVGHENVVAQSKLDFIACSHLTINQMISLARALKVAVPWQSEYGYQFRH
jgi:hypothetical protein